jgi:hypothetical protein
MELRRGTCASRTTRRKRALLESERHASTHWPGRRDRGRACPHRVAFGMVQELFDVSADQTVKVTGAFPTIYSSNWDGRDAVLAGARGTLCSVPGSQPGWPMGTAGYLGYRCEPSCHYRIVAREHRYGSRPRARGKCECSGARPRLTKRQRAAAVHNLTDFGRPLNRAKRPEVRAPLRRFGCSARGIQQN